MKVSELKKHDSSLELCFFHLKEDFEFQNLSSLDSEKPFSLYFLKDLKNYKKNLKLFESFQAQDCGLIIERSFFESMENSVKELLEKKFKAMFTTENMDLSLSFLSAPFHEKLFSNDNNVVDGRQMETAQVHPTALIGQNVFIGENVIIEKDVVILPGTVIMANSRIGEGSKIFPNVTIYHDVHIGKFCRIHSQTVIGSDGYGYNFQDGVHHKVWHLGGVRIGDHVEVGANTCIDRGALGHTRIGNGSKIDNLVQVAHNCQIGKGVIICGQAGFGGSSVSEDFCVFGGRAALAPGETVGMGSQIAGNAMVTGSCPPGSKLGGHPARPLKEWMRSMAVLRRLAKGDN